MTSRSEGTPAGERDHPAEPRPDPRLPTALDKLPPGIDVPASAVCVFVSGSLVAGWGHATSDVDLYVVSAEPARVAAAAELELGLSAQAVPVVTAMGNDGLRYDVEYWTTRQVDELFEAIPAMDTVKADGGGHALGGRIAYTDRDWFFRLSIATALLGHDWLRAAKQRLADSSLPQLLAAYEFYEADGYIDDALGLLAAGDRESAVLAARQALGHAVDGVLFARGSLAPNVKWRYRKLASLPGPPLAPAVYWRLETARDLDISDPRPWVEEIVQVCQSLMLEVDFS
ncbi:MAG TPA: hypothetical protein VF070_14230 [Streptosporangiaceae bacterium]